MEFAEASGAEKKNIRWMEKFGEWKFANQVSNWSNAGKAVWTLDVCEAGDYRLDLTTRAKAGWRGESKPTRVIEIAKPAELVAGLSCLSHGTADVPHPGKHSLAFRSLKAIARGELGINPPEPCGVRRGCLGIKSPVRSTLADR